VSLCGHGVGKDVRQKHVHGNEKTLHSKKKCGLIKMRRRGSKEITLNEARAQRIAGNYNTCYSLLNEAYPRDPHCERAYNASNLPSLALHDVLMEIIQGARSWDNVVSIFQLAQDIVKGHARKIAAENNTVRWLLSRELGVKTRPLLYFLVEQSNRMVLSV
jgi:hypothetical protein